MDMSQYLGIALQSNVSSSIRVSGRGIEWDLSFSWIYCWK